MAPRISAAPAQSMDGLPSPRDSRSPLPIRIAATTPTGILIKNTQCQLMASTMTPPSSGPASCGMNMIGPTRAINLARFSTGYISVMISMAIGMRPPAPMPWMPLPTSSMSMEPDAPLTMEPMMNRAMQAR